jgi:hypothetical protein
MQAFHGKQSIKVKYINRVIRHKNADAIIQGYGYFKDGKGCAVGCTIHGDNHFAYETELGIPATIAYLEDRIFEGLPVKEAKRWPLQFLRSIKPGADLSKVWPKFAVWLLTDVKAGVIQYPHFTDSKRSIQNVADLYLRLVDGYTVTKTEWRNAASAAYASAAFAADAAAYAAKAAAAAAYTAAYATYADASAAAYYASATATATARQKAYIAQSEKLLQLLSEAE